MLWEQKHFEPNSLLVYSEILGKNRNRCLFATEFSMHNCFKGNGKLVLFIFSGSTLIYSFMNLPVNETECLKDVEHIISRRGVYNQIYDRIIKPLKDRNSNKKSNYHLIIRYLLYIYS